MNARKYEMPTASILPGGPYQTAPVKLGKTKKHTVEAKVCGCVKCGATHTTLYKFGENGKDRICDACFEKHLNETMDKLAGGVR